MTIAGRTGLRPKLHPRPKDNEGRPKGWVCGKCGHRRDPSWLHWENRWYLFDGPCENCERTELLETHLQQVRQRIISNYELDVGERKRMTFENYIPQNPSQEEAKRQAMNLVKFWRAGRWSRGLMLASSMQEVGVGKTHLAIAAAREGLMLYQETGLWNSNILTIWDVPVLFTQIKNSYDDGGPDSILNGTTTSRILLLDDLGVEHYRQETWYQDILYTVFNERWLKQLATIVTTNLGPDAMSKRVGARVWSRMLALTGNPVVIRGKDYRLK